MTGTQWRKIAVGFVGVVFVLWMFILRGGGSYSVPQEFELILLRQSSPAADVPVRMWLGREPPSCFEEQRGNDLQFQATTDRNGQIIRAQEASWGSAGTRRAAARRTRMLFQLCTQGATVADWKPLWTARVRDVAHRQLKIVCELDGPEGSSCRHEVSKDPDRSWIDHWLPLLLSVLFIRLLIFGLKDGVGRAWAWLAMSTMLLIVARGAVAANQVDKGVFFVALATVSAIAGHISLWRAPRASSPASRRWDWRKRNPFDS